MPATPRIRLAWGELPPLLLGWTVLSLRMLFSLVQNGPWNVFLSTQRRRNYWRQVALTMIRTGGYWFSVHHLQFMMPSTRKAIKSWGWMNGVRAQEDEVPVVYLRGRDSGVRRPSLWWMGERPTPEGVAQGKKVVLYIHGGGFVLPCSSGHLSMITALLREANAAPSSNCYLVIAEYTICPYSPPPTQLHQLTSILHYLSSHYKFPSTSLVLAGDSCGGALALSLLSHYLHPDASPGLPPLPYKMNKDGPIAGVLLISPWASLSTLSPSYQENSEKDTLPLPIIQRFRDTYMARSSICPTTRITPVDAVKKSGWGYTCEGEPPIEGIDRGCGVIRPVSPGSRSDRDEESEGWWKDIGSAVLRVLITTGEYEGFRDDILSLSSMLQSASERSGKAKVELIRDPSYHAVLVSDFSFPIPVADLQLAADISGWFVETLRRPEEET